MVGFKVTEDNSTSYRKVKVGTYPSGSPAISDIGGKMLENAYLRGADFVSVRFIKKEINQEKLE